MVDTIIKSEYPCRSKGHTPSWVAHMQLSTVGCCPVHQPAPAY